MIKESPFLLLAFLPLLGVGIYGVIWSIQEAFDRSRMHGWFLVATLALFVSYETWYTSYRYRIYRDFDRAYQCRGNLVMTSAIVEHIAEKGDPNSVLNETWCDRLMAESASVEGLAFSRRTLKCPSRRHDDCGYALNENVIGRRLGGLRDRTVVLFESNAGWNAVGERDAVVFCHADGRKAHFLLSDGNVESVGKDELNLLRWK